MRAHTKGDWPGLTSGVTKVSLRKVLWPGCKGRSKVKRVRRVDLGDSPRQREQNGQRLIEGAGNSLDLRNPIRPVWLEPRKMVEEGADAGSYTCKTSTLITVLSAIWVVWGPQRGA